MRRSLDMDAKCRNAEYELQRQLETERQAMKDEIMSMGQKFAREKADIFAQAKEACREEMDKLRADLARAKSDMKDAVDALAVAENECDKKLKV